MKNKKGFTLIEVIITLAVLGAVSMLALTFFGQGFSLYNAETESADLQEDMRLVLSDITNKVRITDEDSISAAGNQLVVGDTVYAFDGSRIIRGSDEIATSIDVFEASITNGLLEIRIVNTKGSEITTSIYLLQ